MAKRVLTAFVIGVPMCRWLWQAGAFEGMPWLAIVTICAMIIVACGVVSEVSIAFVRIFAWPLLASLGRIGARFVSKTFGRG